MPVPRWEPQGLQYPVGARLDSSSGRNTTEGLRAMSILQCPAQSSMDYFLLSAVRQCAGRGMIAKIFVYECFDTWQIVVECDLEDQHKPPQGVPYKWKIQRRINRVLTTSSGYVQSFKEAALSLALESHLKDSWIHRLLAPPRYAGENWVSPSLKERP